MCVAATARPYARFELVSSAHGSRLGHLAFDCEYEVRVELLAGARRPASSSSASASSPTSANAAVLSFTTPSCDDAQALAAIRVLRSQSQPAASCAAASAAAGAQRRPGTHY